MKFANKFEVVVFVSFMIFLFSPIPLFMLVSTFDSSWGEIEEYTTFKGSMIQTTELGDKFKVKYEGYYRPYQITFMGEELTTYNALKVKVYALNDVVVYSKHKDYFCLRYSNELFWPEIAYNPSKKRERKYYGEFPIRAIVNIEGFRCYKIWDPYSSIGRYNLKYIYNKNKGRFKDLYLYPQEEKSKKETKRIAYIIMKSNDLDAITEMSLKYLLSISDKKAIETAKRYAAGNFTEEEIGTTLKSYEVKCDELPEQDRKHIIKVTEGGIRANIQELSKQLLEYNDIEY